MAERRPPGGTSRRTAVSEHRATRAIEGAKANPAWVNEALVQCRKDVDLARSAAGAGNHKGAVTNACDAIRAAVACHMNASGLRVTNQQGAHVVAVDYAAEAMGDVFDETRLAQYEQLRRLRHTAEYPFSSPTHVPVTGKDAAVAVALADGTVKAVIAWWAKKSAKRR